MAMKKHCKYKPDECGYETACGSQFDNVYVQDWIFCPGCGRPIKLPKSERYKGNPALGDLSLAGEDIAAFGD